MPAILVRWPTVTQNSTFFPSCIIVPHDNAQTPSVIMYFTLVYYKRDYLSRLKKWNIGRKKYEERQRTEGMGVGMVWFNDPLDTF